ncbi:MAG: thioesterase family protein [Verrucomicrobiota bacterium]|nr:thioesterase family protein [Verrucomicrobiota bacterium]
MSKPQHTLQFRVRYGETDQMGSYFNGHVLNWMEMGRTELSRHLGLPYAVWEQRGIFLPVVEAHLKFTGRAVYDTLLEMTTSVEPAGYVRLRFDNAIKNAETGATVAHGYTIHAILNTEGKPVRMPEWVKAVVA